MKNKPKARHGIQNRVDAWKGPGDGTWASVSPSQTTDNTDLLSTRWFPGIVLRASRILSCFQKPRCTDSVCFCGGTGISAQGWGLEDVPQEGSEVGKGATERQAPATPSCSRIRHALQPRSLLKTQHPGLSGSLRGADWHGQPSLRCSLWPQMAQCS